MSKLYAKLNSDTRQNAVTTRGHKMISGKVLYNFSGGNSPEGTALEYEVNHYKDVVNVQVTLGNKTYGVLIYPDHEGLGTHFVDLDA